MLEVGLFLDDPNIWTSIATIGRLKGHRPIETSGRAQVGQPSALPARPPRFQLGDPISVGMGFQNPTIPSFDDLGLHSDLLLPPLSFQQLRATDYDVAIPAMTAADIGVSLPQHHDDLNRFGTLNSFDASHGGDQIVPHEYGYDDASEDHEEHNLYVTPGNIPEARQGWWTWILDGYSRDRRQAFDIVTQMCKVL